MKLLIAGSRGINNYELFENVMNKIQFSTPITHVISGCARGIDTLAIQWANKNNIELLLYPAEWEKYGRSAGMIRNQVMVDECDKAVIFWDGKSHGTAHDIGILKVQNKPMLVFNPIGTLMIRNGGAV